MELFILGQLAQQEAHLYYWLQAGGQVALHMAMVAVVQVVLFTKIILVYKVMLHIPFQLGAAEP